MHRAVRAGSIADTAAQAQVCVAHRPAWPLVALRLTLNDLDSLRGAGLTQRPQPLQRARSMSLIQFELTIALRMSKRRIAVIMPQQQPQQLQM